MIEAPIPKDEAARLQALRMLKILDTPPDERFDRITRNAVRLFDAPMSTLTLVDSKREWFLSMQGLDKREGPRARSFCGHALLADGVMVVPDAMHDPRFDGNPMVMGPPHIRFYAGKALFAANGKRIGVFCIKDVKPRQFSAADCQLLSDLAAWAELELNAREFRRAVENLEVFKGEERERRELEAIINASPHGLMSIGMDGRIKHFNVKMMGYLGTPREAEIKDQDVFNIIDDRYEFLSRLIRKGLRGEMFKTEADRLLPGAQGGWYRALGMPILDASGGIQEHLLITIQDLTER